MLWLYVCFLVFLIASTIASFSDLSHRKRLKGWRGWMGQLSFCLFSRFGLIYLALLVMGTVCTVRIILENEHAYLIPLVAVFLIYQLRLVRLVASELKVLKPTDTLSIEVTKDANTTQVR